MFKAPENTDCYQMAAHRPGLTSRKNKTEGLSTVLSRITNPLFGKRGLADGAIATEWAQIVGPMIALHSQPERLSFKNRERHSGLLHLRVDHSAMATELQHLETQLLERINGYFGYKAVAKMRFIHGPLAETPIQYKSPPTAPTPKQNSDVADTVNCIEDPELRDSLNRLGNAIRQDN
mgnify:FL=1